MSEGRRNPRNATVDASEVDRYLTETLVVGDDTLAEVLRASAAAGLPDIAVSPTQGRFLQLLVELVGARRVLEVGTLGGYSTVCLARGGAEVTTLELDPRHAEVATANIAQAGLADRVDVLVGPAAETLTRLTAEHAGPYDLVFIDADKRGNAGYVRAALDLSHRGTVIVVDNVIRGGGVLDDASSDPNIVGTREVLALLGSDPRLATATALQTVGHKGWDGFAIARVR
ncbi:MAG TPA: O-methyltransferase [Mycobacteriales bacterium]